MRETDKSIASEKDVEYFLKNDNFSLIVACSPVGQNGIGGHCHNDKLSFELKINEKDIIVGPAPMFILLILRQEIDLEAWRIIIQL
jgi:hypothetical protein